MSEKLISMPQLHPEHLSNGTQDMGSTLLALNFILALVLVAESSQ